MLLAKEKLSRYSNLAMVWYECHSDLTLAALALAVVLAVAALASSHSFISMVKPPELTVDVLR